MKRGLGMQRPQLPASLSSFVGRDLEFQQLLSCWTLAKQGRGQVVSVVGEAGLGKSRLIHEFKDRLSREGGLYLEGSCFAYGESVSYLPFIEVVKTFCGLEGLSQEAEAKRQIDGRLASLTLDPAAVTPYLQNLLAFSVDDPMFANLPSHLIRERTIAALKALLLAVAAECPLALIIEDVHWIDKATEEVVAALVDAMAAEPLLVILGYRPEYLHAWTSKAYHTHIPLSQPGRRGDGAGGSIRGRVPRAGGDRGGVSCWTRMSASIRSSIERRRFSRRRVRSTSRL